MTVTLLDPCFPEVKLYSFTCRASESEVFDEFNTYIGADPCGFSRIFFMRIMRNSFLIAPEIGHHFSNP